MITLDDDSTNSEHEENIRILTLCFCSLALTCTEVKTAENLSSVFSSSFNDNSDASSQLINGLDLGDENNIEYIHMLRIPSNIARIFWNELLELQGQSVTNCINEDDEEEDDDDDEEDEKGDPLQQLVSDETNVSEVLGDLLDANNLRSSYWKEFITKEERTKFFRFIDARKAKRKEELLTTRTFTRDRQNSSCSSVSSTLSHYSPTSLTNLSYFDVLFMNDECFQYIRNKLLKSKSLDLVVIKKDLSGSIEQDSKEEEITDVNEFLDEQSVTSANPYFTTKSIFEYFKPNVMVEKETQPVTHKSPLLASKCYKSTRSFKREATITRRNSAGPGFSFFKLSQKMMRQHSLSFLGDEEGPENKCVKLIQMTRDDGGFGPSLQKKEQQLQNKGHYPTTFEIWNHLMAEGCLKLYSSYYCSSLSFHSATMALNMQKFETEAERKLQLEKRSSNKDDTLSYAIKMLPSHLMRARRMLDAIELLQCYDFLFCRICILGIDEGARQIRQDCEEIRLRLSNRKKSPMDNQDIADPEKIILNIFHTFKKYFLEDIATALEIDKLNQGRIIHKLGYSTERMGWVDKSLEFYQSALQCKKQASTFCTNSVIISLGRGSITNAKTAHGKHEEGMRHLKEKLHLNEGKDRNTNLAITKTSKSMALIYDVLGNYDSSTSLYEEMLMVERKIIGVNKIEVHDTFDFLGHIYVAVDDYDNAYHSFEQTLRIARFIHGESHAFVARAHYNLGRTLLRLKDYAQAVYHLSKALIWRTEHLPEWHVDLAKTLYAMGSAYIQMESEPTNIENAITCLEDAIQIIKRIFGDENEAVGRRLGKLALAYSKAGKRNEAIETRIEIVFIFKTTYGPKHETVLEGVRELASTYKEQEQYEDALLCYQEAVKILKYQRKVGNKKFPGGTSPIILFANFLHEIGFCFSMLKLYYSALEFHERAYRLRLQYHREEHIDVAESQYNLGIIHFRLGNEEKAMKYFTLALEGQKSMLGGKSEQVADTLLYLTLFHKKFRQFTLSISCAAEAYKIQELVFGTEHEKVADTKFLIGILLAEMEEFTYSLRFYYNALLTYKKLGYNEKDDYIINTNNWISFVEHRLDENKKNKQPFGDDAVKRKLAPLLDPLLDSVSSV